MVHAQMPPTPQYAWPLLAARTGCTVWVKHENHTPTGAFKARGAIPYIDWLRRTHPQVTGIITATRGNHGQAQARAARAAGLSVTIAEMIEALRMVAGDEVAGRIRREPDATIERIGAGWPRDFAADRALQAGFTADPDFASIIKAHIADEKQRAA